MKTVSDKIGDGLSRRKFLANTSALGAASLLGFPGTAAAEPPPETAKIRMDTAPVICMAPQYLAADLLRMEGFTEIEFVDIKKQLGPDALAEGKSISRSGTVHRVCGLWIERNVSWSWRVCTLDVGN